MKKSNEVNQKNEDLIIKFGNFEIKCSNPTMKSIVIIAIVLIFLLLMYKL